MNGHATLSVIVATYNGSKYIEEQLSSLLSQTRLPDEIVISDDGSSDECLAIAERCLRAGRVRYAIRQNPSRYGYADNFLSAVAHTSGQWVAFCDQDDLWERDKLARCAAFFQTAGVLAITHNATVLKNARPTSELVMERRSELQTLTPLASDPWLMFPGFALVFRRELVSELPFENRPQNLNKPGQRLPHDEWVSFLALALGSVVVLPDALVAYRHHAANASRESWAPTNWRHHALVALQRGEQDIWRGAAAAAERAEYLSRAPAGFFAPEQLRAAAERYARIAALGERRRALWSAGTTAERMRALLELFADGGYRGPAAGGVGVRELVKDAALGITRVRRIVRTADELS